MRRTSRLKPSVCSLLAAAVLLTACGSSKTATPDEPVVEGGAFRQGLVRLASTDPAKAQSVSERVIASQLYTGLTKWNSVKSQAEPALATRWEVSNDQLHWTFKLNDAKASNGETVTSDDIKSTLEHIARRSTGSLLAETLMPVAGWSEFTSNPAVTNLSGVFVIDPKTVRIDLSTPFSDLPSLLANPAFGIVHYAGDATYSTGPFVLSAQNPDSWVLSKVAGSKPHLDQIDVKFFPDARSSYEAFKAGTLDWTPINPSDADDAGKTYGTSLFKPSLRTVSLSFNLANPKFSDIRFREAIVRAVDRTKVATNLDVHASVLNGVVPEGVVGEQAGGCGTLCFFDRQEAQSLVKQAFPNGAPPIIIDVAKGSPFTDASAKQLVDNLADVGIAATIRNTTATDQFGSVTVQADRELFQTSWSAAYPTAGAFIDPLYRTSSHSNVSGLKSADVDKHLDSAFKTSSFNARVDAYRDAEKAVMMQLPVLPIAEFPADSVQSGRMRGISITPFGTFDITSVWASAPAS